MTAKKSGSAKSNNWFKRARNWFLETPDRALEDAYIAACNIRKIENKYFSGEKIAPENASHGEQTFAYFKSELQRNLRTAKVRLREFRSSRSVVSLFDSQRFSFPDASQTETIDMEPAALPGTSDTSEGENRFTSTYRDPSEIILEKLNFIDEIIDTYRRKSKSRSTDKQTELEDETDTEVPTNQENKLSINFPSLNRNNKAADNPPQKEDQVSENNLQITPQKSSANNRRKSKNKNTTGKSQSSAAKDRGGKGGKGSISDRTSFMPRSILRTINRIKRELDPEAEEEVIENFRSSKTKTIISLKFIILLILIPLLTHQVAKTFVIGPIVEEIRHRGDTQVFLNLDMEEEAYMELQRYEERIKFESLIGQAPPLSEHEIEEKVHEKAHEIADKYRHESSNAIKNIFADLCAFAAFGVVLFRSKREIAVLKSFMDDLVYGLSDSAKAFIIILFTDMFVGFHSPHGWEVILEGISRHLGLPESREFIFLFIATFPVILDTVFKYWIFRYLNRISPSAVATYRNMNE
jgi:hypothetical protein